ncbi:TPA: hypothetical protein KLD78_001729 [Legionella pneumophila]|nr:hypothetical protein [Legionella pneumophila]HAT2015391.1 hypothetical protein [Legionella pneumophila]HAT8741288.1 hypothetical protein [Legionella pneumophila]HAU1312736.1 hypothetical protein [Legionella pneumophila]HAU1627798.1 hypothetical protein [Legionella pneumophila]HBD9264099.1 hypothetical protein [Legionella pneumophila]
MEIIVNLLIAAVSIICTWWISHCYYKKSLSDQTDHWLKIESTIWGQTNNTNQENKLVLYEQRVRDAIQDYKIKGTPKYFIDTYNDLTQEEKAQMYDDVLLRAKGRKGKNNPYN